MVDCLSTMVLVSAAAVSSLFLATAAFFRGFTDPSPPRRSVVVTSTTPSSAQQPPTALGLRLGPGVDHLEVEAASSHSLSSFGPSGPAETFGGPPEAASLFPSRFDNLDVDRIMNNRRLVRNYVGCLVGTKPCTAEGKEFRRSLPDALLTECAKCSPRMQRNIVHVVRVLQQEYPREWQVLCRHFDPDGGYRRRYTQYLQQTSEPPQFLKQTAPPPKYRQASTFTPPQYRQSSSSPATTDSADVMTTAAA